MIFMCIQCECHFMVILNGKKFTMIVYYKITVHLRTALIIVGAAYIC